MRYIKHILAALICIAAIEAPLGAKQKELQSAPIFIQKGQRKDQLPLQEDGDFLSFTTTKGKYRIDETQAASLMEVLSSETKFVNINSIDNTFKATFGRFISLDGSVILLLRLESRTKA